LHESPFENIPFDNPSPGAHDAIFRALEASSLDLIGPMQPRLLVIPLRNDDGVVAGGFWGCTLFGWLHVQLLFIPEPLRGRGVGSTLMKLAETEARQRGCIGSHVTSFSFQAAPFYEKLGYTLFGQLDDYPPGHNLLYLRKRFDPTAQPVSASQEHTGDALRRARAFAAEGDDAAAKQAYVEILRRDRTHFSALNEIGALAIASGHRSAARTAYAQAVRSHPDNPIGRVNLGNLLFEDGDVSGAQTE
jgi:GNAT superfamily N-acetyltransferase